MKYRGYVPDEDLPVKPGDVVTICKGVAIRTTRPVKGQRHYERKVAGRTYKVKVHHTLNGMHDIEDERCSNPSVRWAGSGGYWHEVDINDLPEASSS